MLTAGKATRGRPNKALTRPDFLTPNIFLAFVHILRKNFGEDKGITLAMTNTQVKDGRFWAQCRKCGQWREVRPGDCGSELYFAHQEAWFSCCGLEQRVTFVVEKDELDFH